MMSEPLKFEPRNVSNAKLKEHLTDFQDGLIAAVQNERLTRDRVSRLELVVLELLRRLETLEIYGDPICYECGNVLPKVRDDAGKLTVAKCNCKPVEQEQIVL